MKKSLFISVVGLAFPTVAFAQGDGAQADGAQTSAPRQAGEAQPADTSAGSDEPPIVVTAQRRSQTLLEVPQSISVVGGETLERQQATSFADYAALVPGLSVQQKNPGESRVVLRGINTGGASPTVGIYLDEIPFGSSTGLTDGSGLAGDFDSFDLARIEVLRGPQGTLYGANSLGGVVRFITAPPVLGRTEVRGQVGIETVDDGGVGWSANGVVNVPLGDRFALRATGFYRQTPGFIDAIGINPEENAHETRSYGGRLSLLGELTDALSIRLTAVAQNIRADGNASYDADAVTLRPLSVDPITGDPVSGFTRVRTFPDEGNIDYRVYSATINWDLGFADLTSVTSYGKIRQQEYNDTSFELTDLGPLGEVTSLLYGIFAGVDGPLGATRETRVDQRKFTQEVRLASPDSGTLEWLVGGYYTRKPGLISQEFLPFDLATSEFIDKTITVGPPLFDEEVTFERLALGQIDSLYKEYAAFGNLTWNISSRFELTVGARYSHNIQRSQQILDGLIIGGTEDVSGRSSENIFTWSVSPLYRVNDLVTLYGRVAKGYRPGGPNIPPPGAPDNFPLQFESDTVISYEAGIRGQTADRMFAFDASLFYIDWRNVQVLVTFDDPNLGTLEFNGNGDRARSFGGELTASVRPARGLNLSFSGAYTNATLRDDLPPVGEPPTTAGFAGDRLPYSPKWTGTFSADYEWNLGGNVEAYVGGNVRFVSAQATDFDPIYLTAFGRRLIIDGYETLDLRAGVNFERFSISLYVSNATNSSGLLNAGELDTRPGNSLVATPIRPRTFGANLGFSF